MNRQSTGVFQGSEIILYDTGNVDNNMHLAKLIKQYNTENEP